MAEWKTIETAPENTVVDLWVSIPAHRNTPYRKGYRRPDMIFCKTHKCWRVAEDMHYVHTLPEGHAPSYWLAVPPTPSSELPTEAERQMEELLAQQIAGSFKVLNVRLPDWAV